MKLVKVTDAEAKEILNKKRLSDFELDALMNEL